MTRIFEEALDNSIAESETSSRHKNCLTQSSPKDWLPSISCFSTSKCK